MTGWRFAIDRGGTFTDVVAHSPDGRKSVEKLLSVDTGRYDDAVLEGVRRVLAANGASFADVDEIRVGTTVATNALLERAGARVALVVTRGFRDLLDIGTQARPDIFARRIVKPDLLHAHVVEAVERVDVSGDVLIPLDDAAARRDLEAAFADGCRSAAISCLHGWAFPEHERRLARIAREVGFEQVSVSHEVSRLVRYLPRTDTTVADAYLSPVLAAYVGRLAAGLHLRTRLLFMQSNGGLAAPSAFGGKDAVLSGPAGGVVGMAAAARRAGFRHALGFDMGGTSTDVSHSSGVFERTTETVTAGIRLAAPMLQIHTVAAGGGSICRFDGARLRVGPQSAGADPGPACYRRGGPITVTDCNLLLGRIRPEFFPHVFGPAGDQPLDRGAVEAGLAEIAREVQAATGRAMTPQEIAEGFLQIANLGMTEAIRQISIQRGRDPSGYALVAFGGAGGQHACAVADAVGVKTVVVHPLAGVLSAWGIDRADVRSVVERTIEQPLTDDGVLEAAIAGVARDAQAALEAQVPALGPGRAARPETEVTAHLKFDGADTALPLATPYPSTADAAGELAAAFLAEHERRFGFIEPERRIILASVSADAVIRADAGDEGDLATAPARSIPDLHAVVRTGGRDHPAPVFRRESLAVGDVITGPAIVLDPGSTTFVDAGWRVARSEQGDLLMTRVACAQASGGTSSDRDPVLLEVFNNRFMAVAEEMGLALQATASSVNIKERLDFSCALFDAEGGLVANAPHMPVHLGSMSDSVRAVMARYRERMAEGDAFMLNAPHAGGTHLPDITVVAPVFLEGDAAPAFYTAARGHHADVGGLTPGSMPPASQRIEDEGVMFEAVPLVSAGRFLEAETRALLASGPHPARDPDRNIADLKAQVAACARGGEDLRRMVTEHGRDAAAAYMRHVQDNAEELMREVIGRLKEGEFEAPMDSGAVVRVRVSPDPATRSVTVDFTGTSAQTSDNFNAPFAVTRAATLYVFRSLMDDSIPLNEGCLKPIRIVAPEGSMLNPRRGAAVVAGNVETSQIIVDALHSALGSLAASQGTMNNFTFGDARRQYYETVCGGAGAGPDFDGASAVQTHMTNSRLTDPEVLEARFPVQIQAFEVRAGSGGAGRFRGGDGVVRRIRFLAPMTASILANRRTTAPFGLKGGGDGAMGSCRVERGDGSTETLGSNQSVEMHPGDIFVIETPGGGGYGAQARRFE
ncbi:5-oxoprolinase [bacterium]|nr:5-oxoprolinase [bacterium]